ncbi:MAG: tRNA (adenosine(37)-N6)-dimethylallyltransferase MiaA [Alphaproteobacteria bacterium]|nr:tRNA (adenosine(37)-N6)-dimethylallyltransferase MiaA [Alphaproteobacteria bacterium]
MKKKIYIIAGPTASGKTRLSLDLAYRTNGQIINADSIQVYEDVPLLTARPSPEETKDIPHHLFGYLDAFAVSNAHDWLQRLPALVDSIDTPIFVGGTGLYIKTLIEGLSPIPDIPDEIRQKVRQMTVEELKSIVPDAKLTDPQRLMRAAEVLKATGKPLEWWYNQPKTPVLKDVEFFIINVLPDREKLYSQCNYRFEQMLEKGALHQVIDLLQKNPNKTGGVFQALGVKDLIDFIEARQSLEKAIDHAKQQTRNYAKRQMTWFRHQLKTDLLLSEPKLPKDLK